MRNLLYVFEHFILQTTQLNGQSTFHTDAFTCYTTLKLSSIGVYAMLYNIA